MCGIVGYIGKRSGGPVVLEGLKRLEYRGYDSCGLAVLETGGRVAITKKAGKLERLLSQLNGEIPHGPVAIGHTRWATHGKPSDVNAHPHTDCTGNVVVIHNGIIENYLSLKQMLQAEGHVFRSETDTEVFAHLVEAKLKAGADFVTAVRLALRELRGAQAFLAVCRDEPDKLIGARLGHAGGLVVGYGVGEMYIASDLPAILPYTRKVAYLESGELAVLRSNGVTYLDLEGREVEKAPQLSPYDPVSVAKAGYSHFMLKEIHEQPEVVLNVLRGRVDLEGGTVAFEGLPFTDTELAAFRRVVLVACGTSWHAALLGKLYIESLARVPAEAEVGSEFRARELVLGADTLLVAITQSGETVDTLEAMNRARQQGVKQVVLCNVMGSQATRLADGVIDLRAGPEMAVASTKTFLSSVVSLYLLAVRLGQANGALGPKAVKERLGAVIRLPALVGEVLGQEAQVRAIARNFFEMSDFLYLGRWVSYPIALEGALKLKEVSYIHAEGYPGGEMKHGPIALIDSRMPVVVLAPKDRVYDKILGNVSEVKSRDGVVIALGTQGDESLAAKADYFIPLPETDELLSPALSVIPLQMLAYHIALRRGCDIDQPRNLAKTVTVE
ncbi:MAG: glutamine--fructose-6-phosphate transaminase (isomerizing) [Chloroflexota bacterium]